MVEWNNLFQMKMDRKSQVTMEFLMLFIVAFILFAGLIAVIMSSLDMPSKKASDRLLENTALVLRDSIVTAYLSPENTTFGKFEIPEFIESKRIAVYIDNSTLYVVENLDNLDFDTNFPNARKTIVPIPKVSVYKESCTETQTYKCNLVGMNYIIKNASSLVITDTYVSEDSITIFQDSCSDNIDNDADGLIDDDDDDCIP